MNRSPGTRAFVPTDFMPRTPSRQQTPEQMAALLRAIADTVPGEDGQDDG